MTLVDGQPQLVGFLSTSLSSGSQEDGRISTASVAHPKQQGGDSGGDNRSECGTRSSRGDIPSSGPGHDVEALGVGLSISEVAQMAQSAVQKIVEITETEPVSKKERAGFCLEGDSSAEGGAKEGNAKAKSGVAKNKARPKDPRKRRDLLCHGSNAQEEEEGQLVSGATEADSRAEGRCDLEAEGGANPAGSSSTRANQGHPVEPASSKAFSSGLAEPLAASSGSFDTGALAATPVTVSSARAAGALEDPDPGLRGTWRSTSGFRSRELYSLLYKFCCKELHSGAFFSFLADRGFRTTQCQRQGCKICEHV